LPARPNAARQQRPDPRPSSLPVCAIAQQTEHR